MEAQRGLCQVKNDFSDWNVPPPVPTGTIPKGAGGVKPAVSLPLTDIPAPGLQLIDLKLAALSPILQTAPDVPAPEQPKFPSSPFELPDIPLPQAPHAMDLPKQTLHDQIEETSTNMPEPAAPEMPAFPKMPDVKQQSTDDGVLKFPVIPPIIVQPDPVALPAGDFPFLEWPAPGIPLNTEIGPGQAANPDDGKVKPDTKKKTSKKLKGG